MRHRATHVIISGLVLFLCSLTAQAQGSYSAHTNYILKCQGCHLADGSGTPGKVPPLKNEVGRFLHVSGGREYLVQVPGTSQSALTDAEVAAVLNWILETFSKEELPAGFVPYTTQEITRHRRQALENVSETRADLVDRLQREGP